MVQNKSRGRLAVPTTKPLPDGLRLPSRNPHVLKALLRLSRPSLLSLAIQWCAPENAASCGPYILGQEEDENADENEDEDAPYTAARSVAAVLELYAEQLPARKGSKKEVVDRIVEGDWRHGISLRQLAMVETQYILDHPTSTRWTALRISLLPASDEINSKNILPRIHDGSFLKSLQKEIAPLSKAHYYLTRPKEYPITLLRIYLHESPYNTQKAFQAISSLRKATNDSTSRSIFLLFPDGTPFVYVSVASAGAKLKDTESKSVQKFAVEAVPKALSKPGQRYELRSTSLTAHSLTGLLAHRGRERTNAAAGGWSVYADAHTPFSKSALDYRNLEKTTPLPPSVEEKKEETSTAQDKENEPSKVKHAINTKKRIFSHTNPSNTTQSPHSRKRAKLVAKGRFGSYALPHDGKALNRFDVRISDPFTGPTSSSSVPETTPAVTTTQEEEEDDEVDGWIPSVRMSFQGSHVFAGLRQLVEIGVVDGERMPGWMTGEGSVSVCVVKGGRCISAVEAREVQV